MKIKAYFIFIFLIVFSNMVKLSAQSNSDDWLENVVEAYESQINKLRNTTNMLTRDNSNVRASLTFYKNLLTKKSEIEKSQISKIKQLTKELSKSENEILEHNYEMTKLQTHISKFSTDNSLLLASLEKLTESNNSLIEMIRDNKLELIKNEEVIDDLKTEVKRLGKQDEFNKSIIGNLAEEIRSLQALRLDNFNINTIYLYSTDVTSINIDLVFRIRENMTFGVGLSQMDYSGNGFYQYPVFLKYSLLGSGKKFDSWFVKPYGSFSIGYVLFKRAKDKFEKRLKGTLMGSISVGTHKSLSENISLDFRTSYVFLNTTNLDFNNQKSTLNDFLVGIGLTLKI